MITRTSILLPAVLLSLSQTISAFPIANTSHSLHTRGSPAGPGTTPDGRTYRDLYQVQADADSSVMAQFDPSGVHHLVRYQERYLKEAEDITCLTVYAYGNVPARWDEYQSLLIDAESDSSIDTWSWARKPNGRSAWCIARLPEDLERGEDAPALNTFQARSNEEQSAVYVVLWDFEPKVVEGYEGEDWWTAGGVQVECDDPGRAHCLDVSKALREFWTPETAETLNPHVYLPGDPIWDAPASEWLEGKCVWGGVGVPGGGEPC